jgi:hypothetical protein
VKRNHDDVGHVAFGRWVKASKELRVTMGREKGSCIQSANLINPWTRSISTFAVLLKNFLRLKAALHQGNNWQHAACNIF